MTWWIAAALAQPQVQDLDGAGGREEGPPRVVGGAPVGEGDWPDVAGVLFSGGWFGCTGTLIAPDAVLTAGHCVGGITDVVVGAVDEAHGGDRIPVVQTIEYPRSTATYDLAVLKLARPATVEPRAIGLDCVLEDYLTDGAPVAVVGYGATDAAGTEQDSELLEGYTEVADADCSEAEVDGWDAGCNPEVRPAGELAAGGNGVDACFGDSGGPLYLLTPVGDFLIGATSRGYAGIPRDEPCLYGGIYVRPDAVIDWIEEQAGPVRKPLCNAAPEPTAEPIEVEEGGIATATVQAGDPDLRTGPVTWRIASAPAHGTATVGPDGTVTYEAEAGWTGEDRVVVEVDDGGNPEWPRTGPPLTGQVEVAVTVTAAEKPLPVVVPADDPDEDEVSAAGGPRS